MRHPYYLTDRELQSGRDVPLNPRRSRSNQHRTNRVWRADDVMTPELARAVAKALGVSLRKRVVRCFG